MLKRLALPVLLLVLAACGGGKSSTGPALRAHADSLMRNNDGLLFQYARNADDQLVAVGPFEMAPEGAKTSYTVFADSAGRVLVLIESPTSPREWNVEYRHYFDADGRTAFFRRYSGFFDGCEWGMAKELMERSYTPEFEVAGETYKITNDEGWDQDSARCKFDFHFPYEVYPTWPAAAAKLQLPPAPRA